MNLDSIVRIRLGYDVECTVADLVQDWTDGEIAELLEGDEDALAGLTEEAMDYALTSEAEHEEVEVDGQTQ